MTKWWLYANSPEKCERTHGRFGWKPAFFNPNLTGFFEDENSPTLAPAQSPVFYLAVLEGDGIGSLMRLQSQPDRGHTTKPCHAFALLAACWLAAVPTWTKAQKSESSRTEVSIVGDDFLLNGRPTYEGRSWHGHRVEGLLMNNRLVQGTFDDLNAETVARWAYPDTGRWDAGRNNREFLAAMPGWRAHGVLAFTVNFQGGSPEGFSQGQPWENHPFNPDGSIRPAYFERMKRILDEADRLGMVPIVGYFYFGQSGRLQTDENAIRATDTLTQWLLDGGWRNILVEINNESNPTYEPPILRPDRVHELIARVRDTKTEDNRRLLVGTSYPVSAMPTLESLRASDFVLLHGNAFKTSADLVAKIRATRALDPQRVIPVLVNEDHHNDFEDADGRLASSVAEHVSWGWFDWRRPGESFDEGYQSLPANWEMSSERKRAFHAKIAEITGHRRD